VSSQSVWSAFASARLLNAGPKKCSPCRSGWRGLECTLARAGAGSRTLRFRCLLLASFEFRADVVSPSLHALGRWSDSPLEFAHATTCLRFLMSVAAVLLSVQGPKSAQLALEVFDDTDFDCRSWQEVTLKLALPRDDASDTCTRHGASHVTALGAAVVSPVVVAVAGPREGRRGRDALGAGEVPARGRGRQDDMVQLPRHGVW
jgi:hypothetical protein